MRNSSSVFNRRKLFAFSITAITAITRDLGDSSLA
jgi:hypothetical protein